MIITLRSLCVLLDITSNFVEALKEQIEDEENLLLDCIEDYKAEYNVKIVRTDSK